MKTGSIVAGIVLVAAAALLPVVGWRLSVKAFRDDHSETEIEQLVDAAGAGKTDKMGELLKSGVRVNAASEGGMAPLFAAVSNGQVHAVTLLLSHGADVNQRYKSTTSEKQRTTRARFRGSWSVSDGDTPLLTATRIGSLDVAKLLISDGADVKAVNNDKSTALSLAMQAHSVELIRLLVQKGASVAVTDSSGDTPLMWSVLENDGPLAMATIKAGVDVNGLNVYRQTALVAAAAANTMPDVTLLLARTATDVNVVDGKGNTPLSYAVSYNRLDLAKALLARGAAQNKLDKSGSTPLINAVFRGSTQMVRLLLEAHADTKIKDKNGMNALEWAKAKQNTVIASIIENSQGK